MKTLSKPYKLRFFADVIDHHRSDLIIILLLICFAGLSTFLSAQQIQFKDFFLNFSAHDMWFDADNQLVLSNMVSRFSDHHRTQVHPLFPLLAHPPVFILEKFLNIESIVAARLFISIIAALWLGLMFIVLRVMGCHRFDAALFSILVSTSAAARFWFTVPETYPLGSLSILSSLGLAAAAESYNLAPLLYIISSAFTLSITVTNWVVGLLATLARYSWWRSLYITAIAFCLVVVLWRIQTFIFPSANFFVGIGSEKKYMFLPSFTGTLERFQALFFHSMVMPAIQLVDQPSPDTDPAIKVMTVQSSLLGSGSWWGLVAVVLWIALLGLGLWALFTLKQHTQLRFVLGFSLLAQVMLHFIYGYEIFLYSLNIIPLLLLIAALSLLTSRRRVALSLAIALVICVGINNSMQFQEAVRFINQGFTH